MKESEGGAKSFGEGLKVGIYKEAVPMGVDPSEVSFLHAGKFVCFVFLFFGLVLQISVSFLFLTLNNTKSFTGCISQVNM